MMIEICCKDGETLLEACCRQHIFVDNVCGGKGICGKCKVRMVTNVVPASANDIAFFSKGEIEAGWRLACLAKPQGCCHLELPKEQDGEISVVTKNIQITSCNKKKSETRGNEDGTIRKRAIVIDIGTTTVAMQYVLCLQEQSQMWETEVVDTYTSTNRQRMYGADVLSRIQSSNEGNGQLLKKSIMETLARGVEQFVGNHIIEEIYIAGNTTMIHLLMGYSCEQLGKAPFKPVILDGIQTSASDLFSSYLDEVCLSSVEKAKVYIFPGISAFVGGDIVSGLYYTDFYREPKVQLFIDLGTNGEMVVGNRMRMLATSTAAGPAFEGGGLSCGCAGIKGAICGAKLLPNGSWQFKTISDEEPIGICGSGIVEIIYEMLQKGLVDETGLLAEGNLERVDLVAETVYITQQDIRQFQMAKAAIRAGVETLLQEYQIDVGDISQIYIAGGFGYYLDLDKATAIGLFPKSFSEKMLAVGNACLGGLKAFATNPDEGKLHNIRKYAGECQLAHNSYFQEKYIEYMYLNAE